MFFFIPFPKLFSNNLLFAFSDLPDSINVVSYKIGNVLFIYSSMYFVCFRKRQIVYDSCINDGWLC